MDTFKVDAWWQPGRQSIKTMLILGSRVAAWQTAALGFEVSVALKRRQQLLKTVTSNGAVTMRRARTS